MNQKERMIMRRSEGGREQERRGREEGRKGEEGGGREGGREGGEGEERNEGGEHSPPSSLNSHVGLGDGC